VKLISPLTVLCLAVAGCTGQSANMTHGRSVTPTAKVSATPAAMALCDAALQGRTQTAQLTTLGEARRTNIGGPYPGLRPAHHAFAGEAATETAAWCWAAAPHPSPGDAGSSWTLYVAVSGGRAKDVFTMSGTAAPPTGPPAIP
jgi:hypothetical protein